MTFRAKTYENPYNLDGSLNFGANSTMALRNVANLIEGLQNTSRTFDQIKLVGNGLLAYKILPTVSGINNLGVSTSNNFIRRYVNPNSFVGSRQLFQSGVTQESGGLFTEFINTSSLAYSERFGKSELEASANFEVVRGYQRALGFTLYNLDKRLTETGQGAGPLPTNGAATYPQNASSAKSGFGIRSYFATTKYTYDNKYSLNANIRRDGTSRIVNEENRDVTSWSAGFTWNALQERFLSKQTIFSDLKLRLSFGIIPNIGSIQTSSYGAGLQSVTNYQGPQVPSFGTTQYAGSTLTGLAPTGPGNPNLKIERVQKSNIGIDFSVWNGRARFNLDAYDEQTLDLFVNQPLSGTTGFSSLYINAGKMSNKGLELNAKVDVIKTQDFGVTLGVNHSYNVNEILDLGSVNEFDASFETDVVAPRQKRLEELVEKQQAKAAAGDRFDEAAFDAAAVDGRVPRAVLMEISSWLQALRDGTTKLDLTGPTLPGTAGSRERRTMLIYARSAARRVLLPRLRGPFEL
jgi:hypothetical protein